MLKELHCLTGMFHYVIKLSQTQRLKISAKWSFFKTVMLENLYSFHFIIPWGYWELLSAAEL